jgi:large subunit ribosomal protein L13e
MVKHNNEVPHQHFKKDWQSYVKTWFNQPARKKRRRLARDAKAVRVFPRPTAGALRPIVRSQTVRYNSKQRAGRGFTLEELKEAGIPSKLAPTIGIAVDHRRKNRSLEGLQENVARLKAYKAKLLVFPRRSKKPKAGDSSAEELAQATQLTGALLPVSRAAAPLELVKVTSELQEARAYGKLRIERTNVRLDGKRKKRAAEAEKEAKDSKA